MMPCRQSSCNTGLQPTPRHTPTLRYIPPGLAAGQGTQRGLTQRHTAIAETPKHANTEQHHRGTTTHIPTETQLAAETLVTITILPLEIVSDVQARMIPMQDEDRHTLDLIARDVLNDIATVRYLMMSRIIEQCAGYDPKDKVPCKTLSTVPRDMKPESIKDALIHETPGRAAPTVAGRPGQADLSTINNRIYQTRKSYTRLHELNKHTHKHIASHQDQQYCDRAMQQAFQALKITHHLLLKSRGKIEDALVHDTTRPPPR